MAILFPPIIESKIPAQAESLKIYYTPNPMVATFKTLAIKIKTISTNTEVITDYVKEIKKENDNYYFTYTPEKNDLLEKGEFYKIQVAYVEEILTGDKKKNQLQNLYWSSVGIFKWTTGIKGAYIAEMQMYDSWHANIDKDFKITSEYSLIDVTEPIYSYELKVFDNLDAANVLYQYNKIYVDSKPTTAKNKQLIDSDIQPKEIDFPEGSYGIKLLITTINGYKQETTTSFQVIPEIKTDVYKINTIFEEKDLSLTIESTATAGTQIVRQRNGQSIILGSLNSEQKFKDTSILPGEYLYSIRWDQKITNDNEIKYKYQNLNPIIIDFEDMYLSDKNHLLCVRFNPKVGSFKETVLESKQDTIGGRYPFFFRNGNTKYKEFSINGLISYHMDNNETFLNRGHNSNTLQRQSTNDNSTDSSFIPTTQLTGKNIYEERKFKLAVLEWLNNGKPKLFRSPTEGAYLVRLMNISLSPEDQLGRMLHSFQATAYEIDECTLENLRKYECLYEEE